MERSDYPQAKRHHQELFCKLVRVIWGAFVYAFERGDGTVLVGRCLQFCTVHSTLDGTPAMAAGITDETWSIQRLLLMRSPDI